MAARSLLLPLLVAVTLLVTLLGSATALAPSRAPAIALEYTVGRDPAACATTRALTIPYGERAYRCYLVRNLGDVTLTRHTVADEALGTVLGPDFPFVLVPGGSAYFTRSAALTASRTTTASWQAFNRGGVDLVGATSRVTITVLARTMPSLTLEVTAGTDPTRCSGNTVLQVAPGTRVTYCYRVENRGDVTLSRHDLDDSRLGTLLAAYLLDLAPGASHFVTQSVVVDATTVNTATWRGYNLLDGAPIDVAEGRASGMVIAQTPTAIRLSQFRTDGVVADRVRLTGVLLAVAALVLLARRRARDDHAPRNP